MNGRLPTFGKVWKLQQVGVLAPHRLCHFLREVDDVRNHVEPATKLGDLEHGVLEHKEQQQGWVGVRCARHLCTRSAVDPSECVFYVTSESKTREAFYLFLLIIITGINGVERAI